MIPQLVEISDLQGVYKVQTYDDYGIDEFNAISVSTQKRILEKLLGFAEYYKFEQDYSGSGLVWNSNLWNDFVNGKSYVISGVMSIDVTVSWLGIKEVLKYFVYSEYLKAAGRFFTENGAYQTVNENATPINKGERFADSYNDGVKEYGKDWANLFTKSDTCIGRDYTVSFGHGGSYLSEVFKQEKVQNTAYNYLYYQKQADSSLLADWFFIELVKQTKIGI